MCYANVEYTTSLSCGEMDINDTGRIVRNF